MHGSSFVCGYVVCVVAWLSVVVQLVQILCFVPLGDRRIVDVVAVVSLPLPLSLFLFTFGASCMFIMFFLFVFGASSVIGRRLSSKLTLHSAIRFQHLVTSTGVKVTHQATYAS